MRCLSPDIPRCGHRKQHLLTKAVIIHPSGELHRVYEANPVAIVLACLHMTPRATVTVSYMIRWHIYNHIRDKDIIFFFCARGRNVSTPSF